MRVWRNVVLDRGTPDWEYRLRDAVHIHMYISTVPRTLIEFIIIAFSGHLGGDATMWFLASSQDSEMAQLKDSTPFDTQPLDVPWRGRNNYNCYGAGGRLAYNYFDVL